LSIPDPKQQQKRKRVREKKFCATFFCSHKYHKIKNYFIFEQVKKKLWANLHRIIKHFTQKIVIKLSKIWVWDPGYEIRDPEKTYSGSRIQKTEPNPEFIIPDPDLQHRKGGGAGT
jgi:hypothetical protein